MPANTGDGGTGMLFRNTVLFKDDPTQELTFMLSAAYLGKNKGWLFAGKQGGSPIKAKQILANYVSPE